MLVELLEVVSLLFWIAVIWCLWCLAVLIGFDSFVTWCILLLMVSCCCDLFAYLVVLLLDLLLFAWLFCLSCVLRLRVLCRIDGDFDLFVILLLSFLICLFIFVAVYVDCFFIAILFWVPVILTFTCCLVVSWLVR